jgi:hypothetical protein
MALSLDDKLLGEKTHYYCSSDEGEDDDDDKESCGSDDAAGPADNEATADVPAPDIKPYDGTCTNVRTELCQCQSTIPQKSRQFA